MVVKEFLFLIKFSKSSDFSSKSILNELPFAYSSAFGYLHPAHLPVQTVTLAGHLEEIVRVAGRNSFPAGLKKNVILMPHAGAGDSGAGPVAYAGKNSVALGFYTLIYLPGHISRLGAGTL